MAEVVEALEGSIAPIECISQDPDGSIVCSRESDPAHVCPTKLLWTRVRFAIVSTLMETTLADLLTGSADAVLTPPVTVAELPLLPTQAPTDHWRPTAQPSGACRTARQPPDRRRPWPTWRYATCTCASRSARSSEASI